MVWLKLEKHRQRLVKLVCVRVCQCLSVRPWEFNMKTQLTIVETQISFFMAAVVSTVPYTCNPEELDSQV